MTLTPPATPAADSAAKMPLCAMCSATSELLQAVSVLTHGPCSQRKDSPGMAQWQLTSGGSRRQQAAVVAAAAAAAAAAVAAAVPASQYKGIHPAHLQAESVGGAPNQEGQAVAHNGIGVGVRHPSRRKDAVQVLCERRHSE